MAICKNEAGLKVVGSISFYSFFLSVVPFILGNVFIKENFSSAPKSSFTAGLMILGSTMVFQGLLFAMIAMLPIFSTDSNFAEIHYILYILAVGYTLSIYLIISAFSYTLLQMILLVAVFSLIPISILSLCIYFLGKCCKRDGISFKPYYISIQSYTTPSSEITDKKGYDSDCDTMQGFNDLERDSIHYCNACDQDQKHTSTIIHGKEPSNLPYLLYAAYISIFVSVFAFIWGGLLFTRSKILVNGVPWYPSEALSHTVGLGVIVLGFTLVYQGIFFYATYAFSYLTTDSIFKKIHLILAILPIGYIYGIYLFLSYFFSDLYYLLLLTAAYSIIPVGLLILCISSIEKHSSDHLQSK